MGNSIHIGAAIAAVVAVIVAGKALFRRVIVHEYEVGLLYRRGRFVRTLRAGLHRISAWRSEITIVDMRIRTTVVPGQELLSADNVGLKVSLVLSYSVELPHTALHSVQNYVDSLYASSQLALRAVVARSKIDELLERRTEISSEVAAQLSGAAARIGIKLHSAEIKDIMFPGELKKIFSEVVKAQKESQAALERARGETAALRSLANAAKMLENNPALFQLRLLQALSSASGTGGHSIVMGVQPPRIAGSDGSVGK